MSNEISFSVCGGPVTNLELTNFNLTRQAFCSELSQSGVGQKDGSYFVRSTGTKRNNADTGNTAGILILDGDSSIDEHGEIKSGAPNPELVQQCLAKNKIPHVIYSSFSNGEQGDNYFKYRVIIFIEYNLEQLPILLDYFHQLLHDDGVMLVNVKENRTWAQPWFKPRYPEARKHMFKFYQFCNDDLTLNADDICKQYEASHPQETPEPPHKPSNPETGYTGGKISPIKLFNEHWKSPVNYLMSQGYRYKGGRLLPLHCKENSVAGVQICKLCTDGIERVYSHHGNDLLNDGFAHDSFDCFKILECGDSQKRALQEIGRNFYINGITLEKHNQIEYAKATPHAAIDFVKLGLR